MCLFVYGTLTTGSVSPLGQRERKRLHREARSLGSATVRGRLFHVGPLPALVAGEEHDCAVHGEAFLLLRPGATFGWLDPFEAPNYVRVERPVRLASGEIRSGWVYVYVGDVGGARSIASGRWHLAAPRLALNNRAMPGRKRKGAGLTVRVRPRPRFDLPR